MSPTIILFVIRLLSAAILVALVGLMALIIYRDWKETANLAASRQRAQGHLRVVSSDSGNPAVDTLFPLLQLTTLGRTLNNSIVLDDQFVSGEHSVLSLRGNQWWLEDLQSRNGTRLNELDVEKEMVVSAGDIVTIGGTSLRIEF